MVAPRYKRTWRTGFRQCRIEEVLSAICWAVSAVWW